MPTNSGVTVKQSRNDDDDDDFDFRSLVTYTL